MNKMIANIKDLQKRLESAKKDIEDKVFDGEAASVVKVKMDGRGEIKSLVIEQAAMNEDAETLSDLVRVAINKAHAQKEAYSKERLKGLSAGVLPMGLTIPGL